MARTFTLLALIFLLAGCAPKSVVSSLPPPSFNAPVISPAARPTPVAVVSKPAPLPSRPGLAYERAWVPTVGARKWRYIVIHHTATPAGAATSINRAHRAIGYDELGYHFVIGNGTESGNGQIEVGSRWPKQKWGAHDNAGDNRYNDYGIGICLVGNFEIERPTPQQLQSLAKLTAYLMRTYHISPSNIKGHGETKDTKCPGRNLSVASVIRMAQQNIADAGDLIPEDSAQPAAGTELLSALPE